MKMTLILGSFRFICFFFSKMGSYFSAYTSNLRPWVYGGRLNTCIIYQPYQNLMGLELKNNTKKS